MSENVYNLLGCLFVLRYFFVILLVTFFEIYLKLFLVSHFDVAKLNKVSIIEKKIEIKFM